MFHRHPGWVIALLAFAAGCGESTQTPTEDVWEIAEVRLVPGTVSSGVIARSLLRNRSELPRLVCVVGRVVMLGPEFTTTLSGVHDECDYPDDFVLVPANDIHAFDASVALQPGVRYGEDGQAALATTLMFVHAAADDPLATGELSVSWEGTAQDGYDAALRAEAVPEVLPQPGLASPAAK
jgi:hypothetical protein